jgi:hypothetical protein
MKKIELTNFQNRKENDINQFRKKAAQEIEEISRALNVSNKNNPRPWSKFMGLENFEEITNHKIKLFAEIFNFWWSDMNYEEYYWEKRDSGFFGLNPSQKIRSNNERIRERLEILLFNQELFSTAKEVENSDLAKVMANVYQSREGKIENFVWETKKRIELEKLEDMFPLKEEIVELNKKIRNYDKDMSFAKSSFIEAAQNHTNLWTEKECLTAQLASKTREYNELIAKTQNQKGEIEKLNNLLLSKEKVIKEQKNKITSAESKLRGMENITNQSKFSEKEETQNKSWYHLSTISGKFFWWTNLAWIVVVSIWVFVFWKREKKRIKERT